MVSWQSICVISMERQSQNIGDELWMKKYLFISNLVTHLKTYHSLLFLRVIKQEFQGYCFLHFPVAFGMTNSKGPKKYFNFSSNYHVFSVWALGVSVILVDSFDFSYNETMIYI